MVEGKYCYKCKQTKPLSKFFNHKLGKQGKTKLCKKCHVESTKKWKNNNKDRVKRYGYASNIKRRYGINYKEYEEILRQQEYKCALCGSYKYDVLNRRLGVDHNHKTGEVRGLLCNCCNRGLGNFKDSVELLTKAINYLVKFHG